MPEANENAVLSFTEYLKSPKWKAIQEDFPELTEICVYQNQAIAELTESNYAFLVEARKRVSLAEKTSKNAQKIVLISFFSGLVLSAVFFAFLPPSSYEDCVLSNVADAKTKAGAYAAREACKLKFRN